MIDLSDETRSFLENLDRQQQPAIDLGGINWEGPGLNGGGPGTPGYAGPAAGPGAAGATSNAEISWPSVARILVDVGDRRLRSYGEELGLAQDEKKTLAAVWGAVIEKYAPDVGSYGVETVAVISTLAILESRLRALQNQTAERNE